MNIRLLCATTCLPLVACGPSSSEDAGTLSRTGTTSEGPVNSDLASSDGQASADTSGAPTTAGASTAAASTSGDMGSTSRAPTTASTSDSPSSGSSDGDTTASGTTDSPIRADCPALCETLGDRTCAGRICEDECATLLAGQSPLAHDAFAQCAATNPLCFQTFEQCIWGTLYPEPFEQVVIFSGTGYEAFEGMTVRARVNAEGTLTQTTVQDGGFELVFQETLQIAEYARHVLLHVDTDADGTCTPGVDFGFSHNVPVTGDFDAPVFEATAPAPAASFDFVCDSL